MSGFVVSDLADEDIQQAAEYIDRESGALEAGNKLFDRLHRAFARIAARPRIGKVRTDIEPDLRSIVFEQYTIFYNIYPEFVEIRRVLHQRRNFRREFGIE